MKHGFTFTPAISLFVQCADEAELDRLYAALAEGGAELAAEPARLSRGRPVSRLAGAR